MAKSRSRNFLQRALINMSFTVDLFAVENYQHTSCSYFNHDFTADNLFFCFKSRLSCNYCFLLHLKKIQNLLEFSEDIQLLILYKGHKISCIYVHLCVTLMLTPLFSESGYSQYCKTERIAFFLLQGGNNYKIKVYI